MKCLWGGGNRNGFTLQKTQQEFGKGCGWSQEMSAETGDYMQRIQNCGEKFGRIHLDFIQIR